MSGNVNPNCLIKIQQSKESVKITAFLPVWHRKKDGLIECLLPLLGDLKTFAKDLDDANIAVREALQAFAMSADKFGKGFAQELMEIGWRLVSFDNEVILTYDSNDDEVKDSLLQTGEMNAIELDFLEC